MIIRVGEPLFDIVDLLTGETTTLTSNTKGVLYMRRAIRFVTTGAPLGRVTGTRRESLTAPRAAALLKPR